VVDHNAVIFMQPEGPGGMEEGVGMLPVGFPDLQLITQERLAEGARSVNYLVVQRPPVRPHRQGQREGLADLWWRPVPGVNAQRA
jgi:hypothetical protein